MKGVCVKVCVKEVSCCRLFSVYIKRVALNQVKSRVNLPEITSTSSGIT